MTRYAPFLTLIAEHGYYADAAAALRIEPLSLPQSVLVRSNGPVTTLLIDEARVAEIERPVLLNFAVMAADPAVFAITDLPNPGEVGYLEVAAEDGEAVIEVGAGSIAGFVPPTGRRPLVLLEVAPPATGAATLRIRFAARQTIWAYHICGRAPDGLSIDDPKGEHGFSAPQIGQLPDGRRVETFRSTAPIALSARPQTRFSLVRTGPFGPQVVVPVLPAAGPALSFVDPAAQAGALQSDIYVNL